MNGIRLAVKQEEYFYETEKQRDEHVKTMTEQGWMNMSGATRRIVKCGVNRLKAKDEDYVWYACFQMGSKYPIV